MVVVGLADSRLAENIVIIIDTTVVVIIVVIIVIVVTIIIIKETILWILNVVAIVKYRRFVNVWVNYCAFVTFNVYRDWHLYDNLLLYYPWLGDGLKLQ